MYRPGATAEEAAVFGLTLEEASGPPIEVWPDTERSILVFDAFGTQWMYAGMAGVPTGLRYSSFRAVLHGLGIPLKAWTDIFPDLRVMEEAALAEMRRQREKK